MIPKKTSLSHGNKIIAIITESNLMRPLIAVRALIGMKVVIEVKALT